MQCVICECPCQNLSEHHTDGRSGYPVRETNTRPDIQNMGLRSAELTEALRQYSLHPEQPAIYGLLHPQIHLAYACDILHMLDIGMSHDIWEQIVRWFDGKEVKIVKLSDEQKIQKMEDGLAQAKIAFEKKQAFAVQKEAKRVAKEQGIKWRRVEGGPVFAAPKRPPRVGRPDGQVIKDKLDARARGVETFPGWKSLKALCSLPLVTEHEIKIILQLLDILIEGLVQDDEARKVLVVLQKYNAWYLALTAPSFCEEDVQKLIELGEEFATLYCQSPLVKFSKVDLRTRKVHHMFNHVIDTIRMYGCLLNTNTSLWESYHRILKRVSRRFGNAELIWIAEKVALSQSLGTVYADFGTGGNTKSRNIGHLPLDSMFVNRFAGIFLCLMFTLTSVHILDNICTHTS